MVVLYYYAEMGNMLVLGSCNKTDEMVGICVKYGDSACDFAPLRSIYKTQIKQLADYLGLRKMFADVTDYSATSSWLGAELVTDLPYEMLDRVLLRIERGLDSVAIATYLGLEPERVELIRNLVQKSNAPERPWKRD